MSKLETFSDDVRHDIVDSQNGFCCIDGCLERITSIHHVVENWKSNRAKFPLLIQSPINGKGCCDKHHTHRKEYEVLNMPEKVAIMIEEYLQKLKESHLKDMRERFYDTKANRGEE